MSLSIKNIFKPDFEHYEGVYRINIYLLRLLYLLMFLGRGEGFLDTPPYLRGFVGSRRGRGMVRLGILLCVSCIRDSTSSQNVTPGAT
jgi:hypothetical protein